MNKLTKLTVVTGEKELVVYGRETRARYGYILGKVYDLEKCTCPDDFYYRRGGRIFVADKFAEPVEESALNKFKRVLEK